MEKWLGYKKIKKIGQPPVRLFADDDRDGVANVFDCQPRNRRKQDVISPYSGSNPLQEMYNRQEMNRQIKEQERLYKEAQRIEEARNKELARISSTPITIVYGMDYPETKSTWMASPEQIAYTKARASGKTTYVSGVGAAKKTATLTSIAPTKVSTGLKAVPTAPTIKITVAPPKQTLFSKVKSIFKPKSAGGR